MQHYASPTVKTPRLLPYLIGGLVVIVVVGMIFPEKEIWGGILAGFVSVLVWAYSYIHGEFKEQERVDSFKIVAWTELRGLARTLFLEAKVWDEATGNVPTGDEIEFKHKGRRLTSVFQLAAIQANLNRLPDLGPIVAEGVIATMATLSTLQTAIQINFETDDDLYDEYKKGTADIEEFYSNGVITHDTYISKMQHRSHKPNIVQYNSRVKITKLLLSISERAFRTADILDKNGAFRQFQVFTLGETQRIEREQEDADMKLMYAQFRTL